MSSPTPPRPDPETPTTPASAPSTGETPTPPSETPAGETWTASDTGGAGGAASADGATADPGPGTSPGTGTGGRGSGTGGRGSGARRRGRLPGRRGMPRENGPDSPRSRPDRVSLAAVVLLLAAAAATHGAVFGGTPGYVAVAGGTAVGTAVAVAGARWHWNPFETVLAGVVTYLLAGGALALPSTTTAHVVPTLATLQGLVIGAVQAWKDLLTLTPPAGSFVGPTVVPYLSGLACALAAVTIALRTRRRQGWALVPVSVLALIGVLWGSQLAPLALPAAAAGLAVAVTWTSWLARRRRREAGRGIVDHGVGESRGHRRRTAIGSLGMVAGALAVAVVAAPVLDGGAHRDVLRDHVEPPLDLTEYHSPLTSFRYWVDNQKDTTLFTVSGLQEGQRIRLATLDTYDGTVMRVGTDSAAEGFRRTGSTVTDTPLASGSTASSLTITIQDYSGYWLPGSGDLREVRFTSDDAADLGETLYYSSTLESAITTRGLVSGDSYTVTAVDQPSWTDAQLSGKSFATVSQPDMTEVPEAVSSRLPDFLGDADTPVERIRTMAQTFSSQGFYSDGSDGLSLPSHSNSRVTSLLDPEALMIGDDEQYAVAMALMARQAGYPARVVLGFYPETYTGSTQEITGTNAHAWVEVSFSGAGWVPFDPTPPRDQTPQTEVPKPKPNPRPQVLQPPVPPQEPADLTPDVNDDNDDDTDNTHAWLRWLLLGLKVAGVALLVASPFLVILAAKALRRRRRRRAATGLDQVTGSWEELVDQATDLGTGVPRAGTRLEQARHLDAVATGLAAPHGPVFRPWSTPDSAGGLAQLVDSSVFGGDETPAPTAEAAWEHTDALLDTLAGKVSRRRRILARISTTSLLVRGRERHAALRAARPAGRRGGPGAGARRRLRLPRSLPVRHRPTPQDPPEGTDS